MSISNDVDAALDVLITASPTIEYFNRWDLTTPMNCTPEWATMALQIHRSVQAQGRTKHIIGCRGKGPAARWYFLDKAGSNAKVFRRLTLGQAMHIGTEAARNIRRDIETELHPASATHPAITPLLDNLADDMRSRMRSYVRSINAMLQAIEQTTGDKADLRDVRI
jgi:hypothetical protein